MEKIYTLEQKEAITIALNGYMERTGCAASKISRDLKINEAYISTIKNSQYTIGKSDIKSRQLSMVASYVGLTFEREYWRKVDTYENICFESYMYEAKDFSTIKTIIADTGAGKTFAVDSFMESNKHDYVFRIVVGSLHNIGDVINDLVVAMGLEHKGRKLAELNEISRYIAKLHFAGHKPLIMIDEIENLKVPVIGLLKYIYDILVKPHYCGLVLIGTPQFIEKLEKFERKNKVGVPQFLRRIKSGIEYVKKRMWYDDEAFMNYLIELVGDDRIVTLLKGVASNYGEVNDYVEPAMRDADRLGEEFNYEFFKKKYRL